MSISSPLAPNQDCDQKPKLMTAPGNELWDVRRRATTESLVAVVTSQAVLGSVDSDQDFTCVEASKSMNRKCQIFFA